MNCLQLAKILFIRFVYLINLFHQINCFQLSMQNKEFLYLSKQFFLNEDVGLIEGGLVVNKNGTIEELLKSVTEIENYKSDNNDYEVSDFGSKILMPGLIDSHVHVNEPGREDWEGFVTATKAAAAGGFTTIVDMPLNSIPPTTNVENLKTKLESAKNKIFVDVAFWGGFISNNINNLRDLIQNGVVGFKCFLCSSGVPEFPHVNEQQIDEALKILDNTGTILSFHAELDPKTVLEIDTNHPEKYETYLNSKPASLEIEAIKMITKYALKYKNVSMHIVHLSAADALPIIKNCRDNGGKLTVETCHHYLSLAAENIPDYHTEFKCSPPIREKSNQVKLWEAVMRHEIDQIVSDHSPSTSHMKYLEPDQLNRGDFLKAWGGIASNQFGLSLFWTNDREHEVQVKDIYRLMSLNPSKILGLHDRKGKFAKGYDADFVIWDPEEQFTVTSEIIQFKNKITPYMNSTLRGKVHATYVRGQEVFNISRNFDQPLGKFIFRKYNLE